MASFPRSPEEFIQVVDALDAVEVEVISLHGYKEITDDSTVPYSAVSDPPPEANLLHLAPEDDTFKEEPSDKPGALRLLDLAPGDN
jgi:hypothetical protein